MVFFCPFRFPIIARKPWEYHLPCCKEEDIAPRQACLDALGLKQVMTEALSFIFLTAHSCRMLKHTINLMNRGGSSLSLTIFPSNQSWSGILFVLSSVWDWPTFVDLFHFLSIQLVVKV